MFLTIRNRPAASARQLLLPVARIIRASSSVFTSDCLSNRHTHDLLEFAVTHRKHSLRRISNRHRYALFSISNRHTCASFLPFALLHRLVLSAFAKGARSPRRSSPLACPERSRRATRHSPLFLSSHCLSNRQPPPELEMPLTHTKQTLRPFSNRQCFRIFLRTLSPHRRNGKRAADVANADSLR